MITAVALALANFIVLTHSDEIPSGMLWEETAQAQKTPGYHPMIRFGCWSITRFNRATTYMFATPNMIQQGQFSISDNNYFFRAVMANELEGADRSKLAADMPPPEAKAFNDAYARSMSNFPGTYDPGSRTLTITYNVQGVPHSFDLHATNEGDDQRAVNVRQDELGVTGLWQSPDPYPDKLDATTRYKIEEQGLQHFAREASLSDARFFTVIDFRTDGTYRFHEKQGTWSKKGDTVELKGDMEGKLQVAPDGKALLSKGQRAFVRG